MMLPLSLSLDQFTSPTARLSLGRRLAGLSAHTLAWVLVGALLSPARAQDVLQKWNVRYDGTTAGVHEGRAVAVDAAGDVVVTGPSVSANGFDYYTVKYRAATGAVLWSDRYNGTGNGDDIPVAVVLDAEGHVIVTGGSTGPSTGRDIYTRKYNGATGGDLWNQRDNGPANAYDAAAAVAVDAAGNVVVAGTSTGTGSGLDFYTAKYAAATGSRLWSRRYNGPGNGDDAAVAVAVDAFGDVIVTGTSRGTSGSIDWYTAKYNGTTDAVIWDERYNGPGSGDDEAAALAVDPNGHVIVTGSVSNNGNLDLLTVKYAADTGDELWSQRQNGTGNGADRATAVAVDHAGDVVITGSSDNGRNLDLIITKYSGVDGRELWSERSNGPGDGDDTGTAIEVDPQGNIVVTGISFGSSNNQDFYTALHDGRTGRRLWSERFNGPRNRDEVAFPFGLALGPLNSVAITGATQMTSPPLPEFDFITILYTADLTDTDTDGLPDTWELNYWPSLETQGPDSDSDTDGVTEWLEYAFGLDPTVSDPGRLPQPVIEDGFLTITLAKRPGVAFTVETSGSLGLGSWSTDTTVTLVDTAGTLKVRDSLPPAPDHPRFLRVRVTAP